MVLLGIQIGEANNFIRRDAHEVGVANGIVLVGNPLRSAYRIVAAPGNEDDIVHGYDGNLTMLNSYDIIGPGEAFERSGWLTCYKGAIYLISGTAAQNVIVEETVLRKKP